MNLAGWIYIQDNMPWTKVFDIDISYDKDFFFCANRRCPE